MTMTERQKDCLRYYLEGASFVEISWALGINHETVKEHIEKVRLELRVGNSRYDMMQICKAMGLITLHINF